MLSNPASSSFNFLSGSNSYVKFTEFTLFNDLRVSLIDGSLLSFIEPATRLYDLFKMGWFLDLALLTTDMELDVLPVDIYTDFLDVLALVSFKSYREVFPIILVLKVFVIIIAVY